MSLRKPDRNMSKRIFFLTVCFIFIGFGVVAGRLFYMQIIRHDFYQEKAVNNQTSDKIVTPKRGTIYDCNMKELAVSASTEMITVDPSTIKKAENTEEVARELSQVLDLDYDSVYAKVTKDSSYQIIKKGVEKDLADKIREFIKEEKITGITFTDDNKRYYPYGNFASHVIGFTGTDGTGLYGIEAKYNDVLEGTAGRVVKAQNANGDDMPFQYEEYIEAKDGDGVVLTIDEGVQHFLEKHLETALNEYEAGNGVAGIVMNVKTREVVAMATKPDFDLNSPYEINIDSLNTQLRENIDAVLEEAGQDSSAVGEKFLKSGTTSAISDSLSDKVVEEVKKARSNALEKMWRNKIIQDLYEPGSTFKIFTMSSAFEEGVVSEEKSSFYCPGFKVVGDRQISCWKKAGHGPESLIQALENSCNPALMEIGAALGAEKFGDYFTAFGLTQKTGIDLPGEATSIYHEPGSYTTVDLAVSSFGQSFSITPIQLINMVCTVVDDGKLKTPHLVKEIVDSSGNVKETYGTQMVRQVISEDTSAFIRKAMESVVTNGTAKKAYVAGYRVGGKTGTSEKYPRGNGKYIASFVGVAPMDDPQYAVLVMIDEPIGGSTDGGGAAAAPVVARIFEDILPYLNVEAVYTEDEVDRSDMVVPNVIGMTQDEAEETLKEQNISYKTIGDGDTVTDQVPASGVTVPSTAQAILYLGGAKSEELISVPNVKGMSLEQAKSALSKRNLYIKITGVSSSQMSSATVAESQSIDPGTKVSIGTVVTVVFSNNSNLGE